MSDAVSLFIDGGCIGPNPSPRGGTFAGCLVDAEGRRVDHWCGAVFPVPPMTEITNNFAEMYALIRGLQRLPDGWSGTIYSDSMITIGRAQHDWWKTNGLPALMVADLRYHRDRFNSWEHITFVNLDGHPTKAELEKGIGHRGHPVSVHNVYVDQLCQMVARNELRNPQKEPV